MLPIDVNCREVTRQTCEMDNVRFSDGPASSSENIAYLYVLEIAAAHWYLAFHPDVLERLFELGLSFLCLWSLRHLKTHFFPMREAASQVTDSIKSHLLRGSCCQR